MNRLIFLMKDIVNAKVFGLFVFLLNFSCSFGEVYSNGTNKEVMTVFGSESRIVLNDSIDLKELITKEIIYDAPKSGMVNFVWYSEDFPQEELFTWNKSTKVHKNIVYTSMLKNKLGQFKVSITMPKDSKIYYGFWITKNKSGVYQDLWNWRKESIIFNNQEQQTFQAVYFQIEKSKTSLVVSNGWLIFLTLSLVLLILHLSKGVWFKNLEKTSMIKKVVLLGVTLFLFHILARSEIINLHPKSLFYDWGNVVNLFKASWGDFFLCLIIGIYSYRCIIFY